MPSKILGYQAAESQPLSSIATTCEWMKIECGGYDGRDPSSHQTVQIVENGKV
jgi:hypothetical protein